MIIILYSVDGKCVGFADNGNIQTECCVCVCVCVFNEESIDWVNRELESEAAVINGNNPLHI